MIPCAHDFFVSSQYTRWIAKSQDKFFFFDFKIHFLKTKIISLLSPLYRLSVFKLSVIQWNRIIRGYRLSAALALRSLDWITVRNSNAFVNL